MHTSIVEYFFNPKKKQDFFFSCFSLFYKIERRRTNLKEALEIRLR